MNIVWIARLFAFISFCILSLIIHFLLFHESDDNYLDTIFSHLYMHIIYFFISLLLAEHLLNYIKRK
jgi:hypothetical protein